VDALDRKSRLVLDLGIDFMFEYTEPRDGFLLPENFEERSEVAAELILVFPDSGRDRVFFFEVKP
jgi:hypothetical protein